MNNGKPTQNRSVNNRRPKRAGSAGRELRSIAPDLVQAEQAQLRLQNLVMQLERVTFHHIPRENKCPDGARTFEAVEGWHWCSPVPSTENLRQSNVEKIISSWRLS